MRILFVPNFLFLKDGQRDHNIGFKLLGNCPSLIHLYIPDYTQEKGWKCNSFSCFCDFGIDHSNRQVGSQRLYGFRTLAAKSWSFWNSLNGSFFMVLWKGVIVSTKNNSAKGLPPFGSFCFVCFAMCFYTKHWFIDFLHHIFDGFWPFSGIRWFVFQDILPIPGQSASTTGKMVQEFGAGCWTYLGILYGQFGRNIFLLHRGCSVLLPFDLYFLFSLSSKACLSIGQVQYLNFGFFCFGTIDGAGKNFVY